MADARRGHPAGGAIWSYRNRNAAMACRSMLFVGRKVASAYPLVIRGDAVAARPSVEERAATVARGTSVGHDVVDDLLAFVEPEEDPLHVVEQSLALGRHGGQVEHHRLRRGGPARRC